MMKISRKREKNNEFTEILENVNFNWEIFFS